MGEAWTRGGKGGTVLRLEDGGMRMDVEGGGVRQRGGLVFEPLLVLSLLVGLLLAHAIGSGQELGLGDRLRLGAALALVYGLAGSIVFGLLAAVLRWRYPARGPRIAVRLTLLIGLIPCVFFVLASALDTTRVQRARGAAHVEASLRSERPPLLLVAVSGVSLARVTAIRKSGGTPVLDSLARAGTLVPLPSELPAHAAAAWTSVASGVPPTRHGVRDAESLHIPGLEGAITGGIPPGFGLRSLVGLLRATGAVDASPVTAGACRVPRLWDVVDGAPDARRSLVVGWWATDGATLTHGELVSDLVLRATPRAGGAPVDAFDRAVLAETLARLEGGPQVALVCVYLGGTDIGLLRAGEVDAASPDPNARLAWVDRALDALLTPLGEAPGVIVLSATRESGAHGDEPGFLLVSGGPHARTRGVTPEGVHAIALTMVGFPRESVAGGER